MRLADEISVQTYLAANGSLGITDRNGRAPLHVAVRHGHIEILKQLIAAEADVNQRDVDGWTALHWAAQGGHADVCRLLLDHHAEVR